MPLPKKDRPGYPGFIAHDDLLLWAGKEPVEHRKLMQKIAAYHEQQMRKKQKHKVHQPKRTKPSKYQR